MQKNSLLKSIRGKITFFTAALTITLTVLAVTICFYAFQSYQKKMMIRSSEFNLQSIADNTSADLNNILAFVKCAAPAVMWQNTWTPFTDRVHWGRYRQRIPE